MRKISKLNVELLERKATCAHAADNEKWSEKRKVHIGKKESTRKRECTKTTTLCRDECISHYVATNAVFFIFIIR